MNDERETLLLLCAELTFDVRALGVALLDHDADECRFRAALIGGLARTRELPRIAALADDLERRLTDGRDRPAIGVGASYERLSRALEQLLNAA